MRAIPTYFGDVEIDGEWLERLDELLAALQGDLCSAPRNLAELPAITEMELDDMKRGLDEVYTMFERANRGRDVSRRRRPSRGAAEPSSVRDSEPLVSARNVQPYNTRVVLNTDSSPCHDAPIGAS